MKQVFLLLIVIVTLMQLGIVCQAEKCNAYTTAWSFVYKENPKTDFDEAFHKKVDHVLKELEQVAQYLTEKTQNTAWQERLVELGKLTICIKEEHLQIYKDRFLNAKIVDGFLVENRVRLS